MRKILLGLAATAAIATPLVAAAAANADVVSSGPTCVPVTEVAAVAEVNHIEYKYKPARSGTGPTHWALSEQGTNIRVNGVAYVRDGVKTQTVIDSQAVAAVEAVTCPTTVALTDSTGRPLAGGVVWTVAPDGTWTELGTTDSTGAVSAELLPGTTYEFVMIYGGARQSQSVLVDADGAQVAFQTASATVTFKNSQGELSAGGNVWAVAPDGTWTELGTTGPTGAVSTELLPGTTYEFVMVYGGARHSQSVLIDTAGTSVAFNTIRVEVRGQVTDAVGTKSPVLGGTWWYIAPDGGWHDLGTPDTNGDARTQLLAGTYTFVHVADDGTRHEFKDVRVTANGRQVLKFVG